MLVHHIFHIFLCFRRLQKLLISLKALPLLGKLIFGFDSGILGYLTASFVEGMYLFVLGRYGHLTELSWNYVSSVSPVYYNLTTRQTNLFYEVTPDLTYQPIPYPFDIPITLPPTEHVSVSDNEDDEPCGWS